MKKKRERRVFTAAFKMEAVRRMEEQRALKVPMAAIARDLNVRGERLHAWARQLRERAGQAPADVFPGEGKLPSADEELRQLRRELEVSRQETAFLKKAAAYFAKESR
jgi:transposase